MCSSLSQGSKAMMGWNLETFGTLQTPAKLEVWICNFFYTS